MSDGKVVKFKIQDIPDDMADCVAEFITTYYVREENCCQAAENPEATAEYKALVPLFIKARLSLVCLVNEEFHDELEEGSKDSRRAPLIVVINMLMHREKGLGPGFGEPLCQHFQYKVTAADFTRISSQISAKKAGYEKYCEVEYKVLEQKTAVTFPPGTKSIKMMAIPVPECISKQRTKN